MLPEALSNELCSLKPHVYRLTKCVEFLLSGPGRVLKTQFYSAFIRSQRRFNYHQALAVLRSHPKGPIERMLHDAHQLAQVIRKARFQAGSLDLDFPELKLRLDEAGKIRRIERLENDISHQLIEEFMLLANEAVAARLVTLNRPAIHRIHEPPDKRRLQEYRDQVRSHHVQCGDLSNRREVQKLLQKLNSLPVGQALKIGFLRSLMRARYAAEPIGHYGLAKKKYTHFTSPIRRYADLAVHRALFNSSAKVPAPADLAGHLSETERNSDDAERDSKDVKLFAYLSAQLQSDNPPSYSALVTDVRNFGFFVDVPDLGMSGLVPLSGLSDDFYQFDSVRSQLIGRRTGRVFKLGDRLLVAVAKVDGFKRQVDYKLAAATPGKGSLKQKPHRGHWANRRRVNRTA
jgi:ribonuclease R